MIVHHDERGHQRRPFPRGTALQPLDQRTHLLLFPRAPQCLDSGFHHVRVRIAEHSQQAGESLFTSHFTQVFHGGLPHGRMRMVERLDHGRVHIGRAHPVGSLDTGNPLVHIVAGDHPFQQGMTQALRIQVAQPLQNHQEFGHPPPALPHQAGQHRVDHLVSLRHYWRARRHFLLPADDPLHGPDSAQAHLFLPVIQIRQYPG